MRSNGIDERYITGDAPDWEKFKQWAVTLQKAIGNPLYHWSHLELQRYFGIHQPLTAKNADKIFNHCNEILALPEMCVQGLIKKSNVTLICTTDDPVDSLEWHKQLSISSSSAG